MKNALIYIIEDEEDICELIRVNLQKENFQIKYFLSGEEGYKAVNQTKPDLVLLDIMLPGLDGLEICKKIKQNKTTADLPIIMVTAKGDEKDIVNGLELGADDYVTKPFNPKILIARVKAVLRRGEKKQLSKEDVVEIHDLYIHPGRVEVKLKSEKLDLTSSEFQILHFLARRPGWVFTRSQIVSGIRGDNYAVTERSIDVQIVGLRKKLNDCGDYIETVRGVGYRFKE